MVIKKKKIQFQNNTKFKTVLREYLTSVHLCFPCLSFSCYYLIRIPTFFLCFNRFVIAFAQDLHQEFYEYFPDFLKRCIKLLRTKDAEQIEWSFTCLAYLFKFLWRLIVRDIKPVFECVVLLLGNDQPSYVNDFAAECFSFVARKVKDKKSFLKLVLRNLKHNRDVK